MPAPIARLAALATAAVLVAGIAGAVLHTGLFCAPPLSCSSSAVSSSGASRHELRRYCGFSGLVADCAVGALTPADRMTRGDAGTDLVGYRYGHQTRFPRAARARL